MIGASFYERLWSLKADHHAPTVPAKPTPVPRRGRLDMEEMLETYGEDPADYIGHSNYVGGAR